MIYCPMWSPPDEMIQINNKWNDTPQNTQWLTNSTTQEELQKNFNEKEYDTIAELIIKWDIQNAKMIYNTILKISKEMTPEQKNDICILLQEQINKNIELKKISDCVYHWYMFLLLLKDDLIAQERDDITSWCLSQIEKAQKNYKASDFKHWYDLLLTLLNQKKIYLEKETKNHIKTEEAKNHIKIIELFLILELKNILKKAIHDNEQKDLQDLKKLYTLYTTLQKEYREKIGWKEKVANHIETIELLLNKQTDLKDLCTIFQKAKEWWNFGKEWLNFTNQEIDDICKWLAHKMQHVIQEDPKNREPRSQFIQKIEAGIKEAK